MAGPLEVLGIELLLPPLPTIPERGGINMWRFWFSRDEALIELRQALDRVEWFHSNASLAEANWAKYLGLTHLVRRIENFYDRQLSFPFSDTSTLLFGCYFLMKGY